MDNVDIEKKDININNETKVNTEKSLKRKDENLNKSINNKKQKNNNNNKNNNKKTTKEKLIYGNYKGYYCYRNEKDKVDPRFNFLTKDLFYQKNCLDIGCNSGAVTLKIASEYECEHIKGIDIDHDLIKDAVKSLKSLQRKLLNSNRVSNKKESINNQQDTNTTNNDKTNENSNEIDEKSKETDKQSQQTTTTTTTTNNNESLNVDTTKTAESQVLNNDNKNDDFIPISFKYLKTPIVKENKFPNNVSFFHHNFMSESSFDRENAYDVIMALSISKWIHLNWGDDGLKTFFKKIYKMLKPGGVFIFEPQDFKGYHKRKNLSETMKKNYSEIKFKPTQFTEYLTNEIGFCLSDSSKPESEDIANGFKRNIYKLIKK